MIRSIVAALALSVLVAAAPARAQTPSPEELARREAAAMAHVIPEFELGMRQAFQSTRQQLASVAFEPDEAAAVLQAYDSEIDQMARLYNSRFATIVARRVPLEQIRADADFESPEWVAALEEVMSLTETTAAREGLDLTSRVIKTGCSVRPTPSEACVTMLDIVEEMRAGQIETE